MDSVDLRKICYRHLGRIPASGTPSPVLPTKLSLDRIPQVFDSPLPVQHLTDTSSDEVAFSLLAPVGIYIFPYLMLFAYLNTMYLNVKLGNGTYLGENHNFCHFCK